MEKESRDRVRVDLCKLAFVKKGDIAHGGLLIDISASGVAIEFTYPLGKVENPFMDGDSVEIEIDDIGSLKGSVVRTSEKTIAIKLDHSTQKEEELIAMIMILDNQNSEEEPALDKGLKEMLP